MLGKIFKKIGIDRSNLPRHIAITMEGCADFSKKNNQPLKQVCVKKYDVVKELLNLQIKLRIPILTFYMLPKDIDAEEFSISVDCLVDFLGEMINSNFIHKNKIKVSVLGKWYSLPSRIVEPIKKIIDETKDYDSFFLNFCINYDGQEEIVDACRIIGRKIKADKIDVISINKESIKDELYTSYFLPPDIIIITGNKKKSRGFLLWDSVNSILYFSNKLWPEFGKTDFFKGIKEYQSK